MTIYSGKINARVAGDPVDLAQLSIDIQGAKNKAEKMVIAQQAIAGRSLILLHGLCSHIKGLLEDLIRAGSAVVVQMGHLRYYGNPNPPKLTL